MLQLVLPFGEVRALSPRRRRWVRLDGAVHRRDYLVRRITRAEAVPLVERYHYTHSAPTTGALLYGLFAVRDPAHCLGVVWYLPPLPAAARRAALRLACRSDQVLVLARSVVVPRLNRTYASGMLIARSRRLLRAHAARWRAVVTFADEGQGHDGTLYRAYQELWTYDGRTAGAEPRYIDPLSGRHVARKCAGVTRRHAQMLRLGYQVVGRFHKHRWYGRITPLHTRRRDHALSYRQGLHTDRSER